MQPHHRTSHHMFASSGWLFADMFLALMMVFIFASTVGVYTPPVKPIQKPTPTPPLYIKGIDVHTEELPLQIDALALLNNDQITIGKLKTQVQTALHKYSSRKAALVQTFAGGPDDGQDTAIAQHVNAILSQLGSKHFIFNGATFNNFIDLGEPFGQVTIRIYFYVFNR
jgi:hypothetical protein